MIRHALRSAAALAGLATVAAPAHADTLTLAPTADNTLYFSPAGNLSNGAGTGMFVGVNGIGEARRTVIRFDVASSIPAGSVITGVRLELVVTSAATFSPEPTEVHRVTADWGEGSSVAFGGGGAGGGAAAGDATWIHTFFSGSTWAAAGGDFVASPSATFGATDSGTQVVTGPGLVADVQAWLDGTSPDFGWLLKDDDEGARSARRYGTREAFSSDRPQLVVDFTPPGGNTVSSVACTPNPNSTGLPARLAAIGSDVASDNDLTLVATDMPPNQFGMFLVSRGLAPQIPTFSLCLAGPIGRYNAPGQILNSGPGGTISLALDLTQIPQGSFFDSAMAGDVFHFQTWFRDVGQGASAFTEGVTVMFQ